MKYELFTNTKKILVGLFVYALSVGFSQAQNDTMYVMKTGVVVGKYNVNTQVDSVVFYKPTCTIKPNNLSLVNIPAGTFSMGSPIIEVSRSTDENQFKVTLTAYKMSKYEITNTQYAAFLNAKSIRYNGLYAAGAYPTQILISTSAYLNYTNSQWVPAVDYETSPVVNVTWYGATEFATYMGGTLPTEAQWEYACRAGSTTPFSTGSCLSYLQANYWWSKPYDNCTNANTTMLQNPQPVGTYAANAFGLYDMHGNVSEWCSDWCFNYPTSAETNPTGARTGICRVIRGGSWGDDARFCRSAGRNNNYPFSSSVGLGFRVVFAP